MITYDFVRYHFYIFLSDTPLTLRHLNDVQIDFPTSIPSADGDSSRREKVVSIRVTSLKSGQKNKLVLLILHAHEIIESVTQAVVMDTVLIKSSNSISMSLL